MRVLVDTNVALDALARREPFYEKARLLMLLGKAREVELFMSATQLTDLFYVLTNGKRSCAEAGRRRMKMFRECVQVVSFGADELDAALASTWPDLEDACVYQAACRAKVDAIVTRNLADFAYSAIPVHSCESFFDHLRESCGLCYKEIAI